MNRTIIPFATTLLLTLETSAVSMELEHSTSSEIDMLNFAEVEVARRGRRNRRRNRDGTEEHDFDCP